MEQLLFTGSAPPRHCASWPARLSDEHGPNAHMLREPCCRLGPAAGRAGPPFFPVLGHSIARPVPQASTSSPPLRGRGRSTESYPLRLATPATRADQQRSTASQPAGMINGGPGSGRWRDVLAPHRGRTPEQPAGDTGHMGQLDELATDAVSPTARTPLWHEADRPVFLFASARLIVRVCAVGVTRHTLRRGHPSASHDC